MHAWFRSTHCLRRCPRSIAMQSSWCTVIMERGARLRSRGCGTKDSPACATWWVGSTAGVSRWIHRFGATRRPDVASADMIGWLLIPLIVGAGIAWRTTAARRTERAYASRFAFAPSGVVSGAESFALHGKNGGALLLLHGSGDTPQTLRYLAERLNAAGYTVSAPLLPGHGRTPRDFVQVSATAYLAAAREALDQLRKRAAWIGV